MEISNEDRVTPRDEMDEQKSSKMESRPLSIGDEANRAVGRPRKRWEDDINQFFKTEETKEIERNGLKTTTHGSGQQRTKPMDRKLKRITSKDSKHTRYHAAASKMT